MCVCAVEWLEHRGKQFLGGKSVVSKGFKKVVSSWKSVNGKDGLGEINLMLMVVIPGTKYGDPGGSRSGYLFSGFPDYWFALGTLSHLQVPDNQGG